MFGYWSYFQSIDTVAPSQARFIITTQITEAYSRCVRNDSGVQIAPKPPENARGIPTEPIQQFEINS